jgi:hypothetical protein
VAKVYRLLDATGATYESPTPGALGGNTRNKVYGRLDCPSALWALARGGPFARYRVFFADEASAIAAGYRPCWSCLRTRYAEWKRGPQTGTVYAWRTLPRRSAGRMGA